MFSNKLIEGIITLLIGLLFVILKQGLIGIALTVLGMAVIVYAIVMFVNKRCNTTFLVSMSLIGILIIVFGWIFLTLSLYILAIMIICYSVMLFKDCLEKTDNKNINAGFESLTKYLIPSVYFLTGICLLFNQAEFVDTLFIIAGILLCINGVMIILKDLKMIK